ncbi:hypothetical protein ACVWZV_002210 [Bradyrhizobium sp. GM5.1]
MSDRATRSLSTKNGHQVVLFTYMTGGEFEQVQDVFLKKMEVGRIERGADGAASAQFSGVSASMATESGHLSIKTMVVSVDGKTDNVLAEVLKLPVIDYREVLAAIEEATGDKKK